MVYRFSLLSFCSMHARVCVCMHAYVCVCACMRMCVCVCVHAYVCVCVHAVCAFLRELWFNDPRHLQLRIGICTREIAACLVLVNCVSAGNACKIYKYSQTLSLFNSILVHLNDHMPQHTYSRLLELSKHLGAMFTYMYILFHIMSWLI